MDKRVENKSPDSINKAFNDPARPLVAVDVERYQSLIDEPGVSEAQKKQFLEALWSIVVTFVDLGFGVHPLQEVLATEDAREAFDRAGSREPDKTRNKGEVSLPGGPEVE